ncbi:hypothetical protein P154DRAFT_422340 [Amniculicola lignicola CBS 123094]|uniref:Uncharacterized protein n=1 Tax=Amniculicola lignicola CBS 123094 TaxID=1392246 RepID=A0A6A5X2W6_9PLEO|nr:hypothetical protein P154DRAFT_422340 [Amniculicola lignicola CBS 123094]
MSEVHQEQEQQQTRPSHPIRLAPAPWQTKSECYWLLMTLRSLPKGIYDPLEEEAIGLGTESEERKKEVGEFKGGLGIIMVVRYTSTPVGPYDEIIVLPGNFSIPKTPSAPLKLPKKALRITRIYVSQRTTCYNGRVNWNIPKHLARFSFSAPPTPAGSSPPESMTVKVYPPSSKDGDGTGPFFACTLKPFRWIPAVSLSTKWLPLSTVHAQPPVPEAPGFQQASAEEAKGEAVEEYDINPKMEESLMAGTEKWRLFPIHGYYERARGCWVKIHQPGEDTEGSNNEAVEEASKYWPVDAQPWSIGAWMEDANMEIPLPLEWKL